MCNAKHHTSLHITLLFSCRCSQLCCVVMWCDEIWCDVSNVHVMLSAASNNKLTHKSRAKSLQRLVEWGFTQVLYRSNPFLMSLCTQNLWRQCNAESGNFVKDVKNDETIHHVLRIQQLTVRHPSLYGMTLYNRRIIK